MTDQDLLAAELERARAHVQHLEGQVALLERRLEAAERLGTHAAELELALRAAHVELDALRFENEELRRGVGELEASAERFRSLNDALMGSASWRMTRPLRALKAVRRR